MSFSDAIGQIDQIVQWEQQLANPAAATQTASSGATTTADQTNGTRAGTSSFSDALAQAQSAEGSDTSSLLDPNSSSDGTSSTSDLLSGGDSQLLAALTNGSGTSGTSGTSDTGSSTSSLITALESALQSSGASSSGATSTGAAGVTGATSAGAAAATATSASDPRVEAMVQEANSLVGEPYVWGGGHSGWGQQTGYDCSGFVSAVLHAGGYLSSPADTTTLPSQAGIEQGAGQYVTIYDRDQPGQEGHVIIQIDGQFYESGGEQGSWGGGGGVQKISTPSAAYLATFNQVLHPAGL